MRVYPNPFNTHTIVEYELKNPGKVNIVLYDISGRSQLLMSANRLSSGKHKFVLDGNKYKINSGIYILKVEINGISSYKRIMKVN